MAEIITSVYIFLLQSNKSNFSISLDSVGVRFNGLLWGAVMICTAVVVFFPHPMGFKTLLASIILRFVCTFGLRITLFLLGLINVRFCPIPFFLIHFFSM